MIPAASGSHLRCLKCAKTYGKIFYWPKKEWNSVVFQVFPCTTQIAPFWPKLLIALFMKKPWYPCPFEILEEALIAYHFFNLFITRCHLLLLCSLIERYAYHCGWAQYEDLARTPDLRLKYLHTCSQKLRRCQKWKCVEMHPNAPTF
jgi:hypothetical protein